MQNIIHPADGIKSDLEPRTPMKNDNSIFNEKCSPRTDLTRRMISNSLRFNQSYKCLEHTANLMNSTPGAEIQIPNTTYRLKKMVPLSFMPQFYIYCATCKSYSMTTTSNVKCELCFKIMKRANSKYFTNLPLKPQLIKTIHKNFKSIIEYDQKFNENNDIIRDFQDGNIYRNAKTKYQNSIILPLVGNTDGARIFNSSNNSIWPIQFYQCFLPPNARYIPENIIVAAIHEGIKHHMKCMFSIF